MNQTVLFLKMMLRSRCYCTRVEQNVTLRLIPSLIQFGSSGQRFRTTDERLQSPITPLLSWAIRKESISSLLLTLAYHFSSINFSKEHVTGWGKIGG
jgi:hypothetical protein